MYYWLRPWRSYWIIIINAVCHKKKRQIYIIIQLPIHECSECTALFDQNSTWTTVDSMIRMHLAYPPCPTILDRPRPTAWYMMQCWDIGRFYPRAIWRGQCRHNRVVWPMQNSWDLPRLANCPQGTKMWQDVDSVRSILVERRRQPMQTHGINDTVWGYDEFDFWQQ